MKIMHINCSDSGSTGKIISDISSYAKDYGHESILCAPSLTTEEAPGLCKYSTSLPFEQGIYRRISYITGIPYGFAPLSTSKIIKLIKKNVPDIVHLHSVNGSMVNVYSLLTFLKKKKIPTVITNHAEFLYTGNCPHAEECDRWMQGCGGCSSPGEKVGSYFLDRTHQAWMKMKKSMSGFEKMAVVSVSPWVRGRAMSSPIMDRYDHYVVENGVNVSVFNNGSEVYSEADKPEKKVLHITSHFTDKPGHLKGGYYFVELAKRFCNESVKFVVAGAIGEVSTELPENLVLLGNINDQRKLAELYQHADLTVVLSKRETFGMAVAESLCCGTPVVGFKAGGPESIAIEDYTEFVDYADVDKIESVMREKWLDFKTSEKAAKISEDSIKKYNSELMARQYLDIYEKLRSGC